MRPQFAGLGHAAVITGNDNDGYRYDSFGTVSSGNNPRHGIQVFTSLNEALEFARQKKYTDYALFKSSPEQDKLAQQYADQWHSGLGSNYSENGYHATNKNCESLVNGMANAVDIEGWISISKWPSLSYGRIKNQASSYGSFK